ncbi:MAG: 50S ribosomal protein L2 [Methanocalculus sp. MSAO_Arc1]|uniref:50S ribosomal protein L2 n=1 Tax=Methanocalculus TaxID=71151 RepID=UPI000FF7C21A|nr:MULTISPECIES: 50S ribosomal protein L2 [unclassified Methanocalculus]MCP1662981.1 large subunit ribosomal protein L2 [Methanocalculus sp. AMF5]RQD80750.1 MAG: 50S ribosomal protein L2 [Methanocalculus sp. MSAO_Arc1]
MGHRISSQARGKGGPSYRAPSHKYKSDLRHPGKGNLRVSATIIDITHDPARHAPIALVRHENGEKAHHLVTEGMGIGDVLEWGLGAAVRNGNTLLLKDIPTGAAVCNIEARPDDGGKFVRSSGVQALVIGKSEDRVGVRMPSGVIKWFNSHCRATIGIVAGGGRGEKPLVKAGKAFHKIKSQATKWPRVRGVAMNVIDHPFGGGNHQHTGRPKTVSRGTPPGRKVGHIAPRRTGAKR